jgi:hypothetical protein
MLRPTPATPAVVFDTATDSLAPLHERMWAAVEDDDLIEGVAAVERLAASMAAARARMLAELGRHARSRAGSWRGPRRTSGTPTSPAPPSVQRARP